ncbi:MAG: DUF58 domain-containing protein, partial [Hymenobacteraceae bacterium]|nr:DUF58 domain-containing protein [Hymenobacteraceae bacterium]
VRLYLENRYRFRVRVEVLDETPAQLQWRDAAFWADVPSGQTAVVRYAIRPTKRGEYAFGAVRALVASPLGLLRRRYTEAHEARVVRVYPAFAQLRQYELLAISNRLTDTGVKRIRRLGQSMEFEQLRPYTVGDDPRTINWRATARRLAAGPDQLIVNHYQDERAQQVLCLIDKSRVMRMPFAGLSLLDYAINATLVLSNIALLKHDKAGLITFAEKISAVVAPERRPDQLRRLLEVLYHQKTRYLEADPELLYTTVRARVKQRSLLVLFTNFETLTAMQRQLPYLRRLAQGHLLLVVFFENTELADLLTTAAASTDAVYEQTVAEKFAQEKRQIVLELRRYGIHALLTPPASLTVNVINRYLEFKSRGMI